MAVTIITRTGKKFTWNIMQPKPKFSILETQSDPIVQLTADSGELTHIIKLIHNIPYTVGSCTWRNDHAQFIFENLSIGLS